MRLIYFLPVFNLHNTGDSNKLKIKISTAGLYPNGTLVITVSVYSQSPPGLSPDVSG